jgi:hypothetical protein
MDRAVVSSSKSPVDPLVVSITYKRIASSQSGELRPIGQLAGTRTDSITTLLTLRRRRRLAKITTRMAKPFTERPMICPNSLGNSPLTGA